MILKGKMFAVLTQLVALQASFQCRDVKRIFKATANDCCGSSDSEKSLVDPGATMGGCADAREPATLGMWPPDTMDPEMTWTGIDDYSEYRIAAVTAPTFPHTIPNFENCNVFNIEISGPLKGFWGFPTTTEFQQHSSPSYTFASSLAVWHDTVVAVNTNATEKAVQIALHDMFRGLAFMMKLESDWDLLGVGSLYITDLITRPSIEGVTFAAEKDARLLKYGGLLKTMFRNAEIVHNYDPWYNHHTHGYFGGYATKQEWFMDNARAFFKHIVQSTNRAPKTGLAPAFQPFATDFVTAAGVTAFVSGVKYNYNPVEISAAHLTEYPHVSKLLRFLERPTAGNLYSTKCHYQTYATLNGIQRMIKKLESSDACVFPALLEGFDKKSPYIETNYYTIQKELAIITELGMIKNTISHDGTSGIGFAYSSPLFDNYEVNVINMYLKGFECEILKKFEAKCGGQSTFVNRTASSVDVCGAYDGLKEEARKTHTLRDLEFTKSLTYY